MVVFRHVGLQFKRILGFPRPDVAAVGGRARDEPTILRIESVDCRPHAPRVRLARSVRDHGLLARNQGVHGRLERRGKRERAAIHVYLGDRLVELRYAYGAGARHARNARRGRTG